MVTILGEILIILALVLLNGVFSGTEIAVLTMRRSRLQELAEEGRRGARAVLRLRDLPERFIATVQIGITVVGATAAAYGGDTLADPLADRLRALGLGRSSEGLALGIVVGLVSYLSLVLGELVPKSLALRYSETYATTIARPILAVSGLVRPLVWLLTGSSNLVLRLFGDTTTFTESRYSGEELQQLVDESARAGALDPRVAEIASRAFDFSELKVGDIMVPANRVVSLPRDADPEELKRVLVDAGHSRIPIYEGEPQNVVGYVIAREVLAQQWKNGRVDLDEVLRPAYFVPEMMRAVDVLQELQRRRMRQAIVVDEVAGLAGLVTTEDLVEELVGELFSEHEVPEELIHPEPDGTWLAKGWAPIRDLNRLLPFELPEGPDYSTIGGLCIALAGAIPRTGDRLETADHILLEVAEASPRRVRLVRIHPPPPTSESPGDSE